jgi:N-acylneuraminate cytidylyltransferase/CMP-N,N'-diacetyllegionaminic acid synthase
MIDGKEILGIIPARAGSKGLPHKNMKLFCGKPLISWTIEAALTSKYIDKVIVSTDSLEIAKIANQYGELAPFIRPAFLSTDTALSIDVIRHVCEYSKEQYAKEFDYISLLEPTSPLRETSDIDNAIFKLNTKNVSSIVGISETESQNPAFLVKKDTEDFISWYDTSQSIGIRRQEIDPIFYLEGSIYVSERDKLFEENSFYHDETIGYIMSKDKSLEIDDEFDFIMAEALMRYRIENK